MKNIYIKLLLSVVLAVSVGGASAQNLNSGYFLKGMVFRHQLNPAFSNEYNYISIPMLGNINVGTHANIGLKNFLYPYQNDRYGMTTFMNPSVSGQEFLQGLNNRNMVNADIRLTVLSFGFKAWGGFNTFEMGVRSNSAANIPYALFDFIKTGMGSEAGSSYHIRDLAVNTNNYAELAIGHSRDIIEDRLSIGVKLKFLAGVANADAHIEHMNIYMAQDKWMIDAAGTLEGSLSGASFITEEPDDQGRRQITSVDWNEQPNVGGFGFAADLGAVYKLDDFVEGLTVSAALLDIGFINWKESLTGSMSNSYEFTGFTYDASANGSLDDQMGKMEDELNDFTKFYDDGVKRSHNTMLAMTMNIGADYRLPAYDKISFGLLSSTKFNQYFTWTEARVSANWTPAKWFDIAVNYAYGNFGSSLGWLINFHPRGFNFFIGTDHMITRVVPMYYLPVGNANVNINFGFNITW